MFEPSGLRTGYAVFAVAFQIMLVADFIARLVRPELELNWGWIVYVVGIVGGLVLTILLIARGIPTKFVIGPVLLLVWTISAWSLTRSCGSRGAARRGSRC